MPSSRLRHGSDQTGRTNAQRARHETRFCRTRQRLRRSFRFRSSEYARLYENGDIQTGRFTPADFGITTKYTEEDVKGGLPEENARIAQAVLSGRGKPAHNDMVCANMALLLLAGNRVQSIAEGVELARQTLATGRALGIVEAHRDFARNGTLAQAA